MSLPWSSVWNVGACTVTSSRCTREPRSAWNRPEFVIVAFSRKTELASSASVVPS
jgi:hypothetical protein